MAILEFTIAALIISAGIAFAVSEHIETRRYRRGTYAYVRHSRQRRAARIDALRGIAFALVGFACVAAPFLFSR